MLVPLNIYKKDPVLFEPGEAARLIEESDRIAELAGCDTDEGRMDSIGKALFAIARCPKAVAVEDVHPSEKYRMPSDSFLEFMKQCAGEA